MEVIKLLANENIPKSTIILLRQNGIDITAIAEGYSGISDVQVLQMAEEQERIIVTFDRDYGELIFQKKLHFTIGLIYLRFIPQKPSEPAEILMNIFKREFTFKNKFSVIDRDKIRQRPILN